MAIWYILLAFGIFCDHCEYFCIFFTSFGMFCVKKIWQPCREHLDSSFELALRRRGKKQV
jgi:hypothetical protein